VQCNAQDLYNEGEDLDLEHFKVLIGSRGAKFSRAKAWRTSTLLKKWEKMEEDNQVWEEESELKEMKQKMEK
jgi:hypothetical protein